MNILTVVVASVVLVLSALVVFRKVARDYQQQGRLTGLSSFLEVFIFFWHGVGSAFFVTADWQPIETRHWIFWVAVSCLAMGLVLVLIAMSRLGMRQSVGQDVSGLQVAGLYRYTRNPQIVAYALVVIGYALLWPAWSGLIWVAIYGLMAHLMVSTEEAHLQRVYGAEYERYCARVPRYVGPLA
ncbi:hypothetical protein TFLX_04292 [Thermoflexales bacterium]|nr:hypothetical protein TFLX_04292 [Thermoflexales bacterium]